MGDAPEPIVKHRPVVVGWRHRCENCGNRFEAKRRSARTCSGRCRKALQRSQTRLRTSRCDPPRARDEPALARSELCGDLGNGIGEA